VREGANDGWPAAPRRGGRGATVSRRPARTLSRAAIVDAALAILDAEGMDAVTMRRVAQQLGTGPASLYAHVADKGEMVAAILDRIFGEIELPSPIDPDQWAEQLKDICRSGRSVLARHRDIARASLGNVPTGENALPIQEAFVAVLLAGGVSPSVAGMAVDILALYITATAYEESLETGNIAAAREQVKADSEGFHLELRNFFSSLPASRFPTLVAMAEPLTTGDHEERFEFGLDLLVRGIASTVKPS
jgi:AcrR family transcriptional regulator